MTGGGAITGTEVFAKLPHPIGKYKCSHCHHDFQDYKATIEGKKAVGRCPFCNFKLKEVDLPKNFDKNRSGK